jgi:hypothetical protein
MTGGEVRVKYRGLAIEISWRAGEGEVVGIYRGEVMIGRKQCITGSFLELRGAEETLGIGMNALV